MVYLLPLVFVFALLAFASYTFLYTLCYVRLPPLACGQRQRKLMSGAPHRTAQAYLWQARHRTLTAALYALAFTALDFGCTGNFWMSYARGTASFVPLPDGQLVPEDDDDDDDDEEATLGLRSASSQLAKFVRPTLDRHEEEDLAAAQDESLEQQEHTALLSSGAAPTGPESKHKRGSNTRRRLVHQVKSDGSARFCRKVTEPASPSLPLERETDPFPLDSATSRNRIELITARPVGAASSRWITTVPGSEEVASSVSLLLLLALRIQ